MPQRDSAPLGAPCWLELFTSDTGNSENFYSRLFGWTAEHAGEEYGGYINFNLGERRVAGCMKNDGQAGSPDGWFVYLATGDAEATAAAAEQHGGEVLVPAMQVGDLGAMTVLRDVGGAVVSAWQPGTHAGIGVLGEPGTPAWFELHTRDYDPTVRFYRDVFSWDTHVEGDAVDFRYTTLGAGESAQAGIMDVSGFPAEEFPTRWSVYFGAADADATASKITELGGTVLWGPDDTPYGRLTTCADPAGVVFKLVAPS